MKNEKLNPVVVPQLNKRESGVEFTHIKISPIVQNRHYMAEFSFIFFGMNKMIETTIYGDSKEECVKKVEDFLQTTLEKSEYSFLDKKK